MLNFEDKLTLGTVENIYTVYEINVETIMSMDSVIKNHKKGGFSFSLLS